MKCLAIQKYDGHISILGKGKVTAIRKRETKNVNSQNCIELPWIKNFILFSCLFKYTLRDLIIVPWSFRFFLQWQSETLKAWQLWLLMTGGSCTDKYLARLLIQPAYYQALWRTYFADSSDGCVQGPGILIQIFESQKVVSKTVKIQLRTVLVQFRAKLPFLWLNTS